MLQLIFHLESELKDVRNSPAAVEVRVQVLRNNFWNCSITDWRLDRLTTGIFETIKTHEQLFHMKPSVNRLESEPSINECFSEPELVSDPEP